MLARLAGNCFWLGRYLERAENVARTLGVAERLAHAPEHHRDPAPLWTIALMMCCDERQFRDAGRQAAAVAVLEWCFLGRDNSSSVVSCLRAARDNARTARHLLTTDFWEALNGAWIETQGWNVATVEANGGWEDACAWATRQCLLARGAALELERGELPHVLALGQAVERAAFTATVLAMSPITGAPDGDCGPGSALHRRAESALRAAGGADTFARAALGGVTPRGVVRFLTGDLASPRSLAVNARAIADAIVGLTGGDRSAPTLPAAQALTDAIYAAVEQPTPTAMQNLTTRLFALSDLIQRAHFGEAA